MPHPLVISLMVILSNRLVCSSFNNDSVKALFVLTAITVLPSFFPITAFLSYTLRTARLPPDHSAPFLPPAAFIRGRIPSCFLLTLSFCFKVLFPCRTGKSLFLSDFLSISYNCLYCNRFHGSGNINFLFIMPKICYEHIIINHMFTLSRKKSLCAKRDFLNR